MSGRYVISTSTLLRMLEEKKGDDLLLQMIEEELNSRAEAILAYGHTGPDRGTDPD